MVDISITPEATQVSYNENGVKHLKNVDLQELITLLNSNAVFDFGLLPPNCRYISSNGNAITVAVELPPGKRDLTLKYVEGDKEISSRMEAVHMPAAMFVFQILRKDSKFHIKDVHLFAMDNDRLFFSKDKMFVYPLPNVYGYGEFYKICWGRSVVAEHMIIKSLAGVEGMVNKFITDPFNSDLFGTQITSEKFPWNKLKIKDVKGYFEILRNDFKSEWLRPAEKEFATFDTMIKTFTKR